VRGCSRRCPGCIAGPILSPARDPGLSVLEVAERLLAWPEIDGLTFSGGEPFEQAEALTELCSLIRVRRDLSIMSYTGYTLAELRASHNPAHHRLLDQLDLLIDGPFVESLRTDLLWRGSANQKIHLLTPRHAELEHHFDEPGAGIEIHVRPDGGLFWAGVPERRFQLELTRLLEHHGITLTEKEGIWT
jgi:anaerobic ribonucleoside-triphosphate reductase activating protein